MNGGELVKEVRAADGHEAGKILYSEQEWSDETAADYEQAADGEVTFQGQPTGYQLVEMKDPSAHRHVTTSLTNRDDRTDARTDDSARRVAQRRTGRVG